MTEFNPLIGSWRARCGHGFNTHGQAAAHEAVPCTGAAKPPSRRTVGFVANDRSTWPRKGETAVWRIMNQSMGMRLVERVLERDWKDMPSGANPPEYTFRK